MMRSKFIFCIMILSILALSCTKGEKENKKVLISVIPKGTTHEFWQSVHAGAVKAATELSVEINWIGPEKEDDRQQQIALVDNQIMNQVSGIVLAPLDAMALRRPVKSAVQKGIPVVIMDSGLNDSEDVYSSFVATDNVEGGRLAARKLAENLNNKGDVIVLRYVEGSASTENRAKGFLEVAEQIPGINVVSHEQYSGATKSQAQQAAENILLRFKDAEGNLTIQGIFCVNESCTYGMLQALKRQRLTEQVSFVGFDSSEPLIDALKNNEIHGLVVQNPFRMGYEGVKTMVQILKKEPVAKRIDTGVIMVTSANLEHTEIKELLYPDLGKWLK